MADGQFNARGLVRDYLARIRALDKRGPKLNAIIETNPDALHIAGELDRERRNGHVRGPLHGIPVLLKDNIDTGDKMLTTAGSLGLVGAPAPRDSTVAANLRAAGAVILGKTNLSEWANFRSTHSSSGWSGRDGQTRNPYVLDRNPCGSSSGSGVAPSANLTAVSIGTETDGSIVWGPMGSTRR
jgi:amidase